MRVDFYQLGADTGADSVLARLADKLLDDGERLLVVAEDEAQLARLDRLLWEGSRTSFRPHGLSGGADDARQPILLSTGIDAPNGARNLLIADGKWRDAALTYDRAFFLFDADTVEAARATWRALKDRDGVERHYWAHDEGRWVERS